MKLRQIALWLAGAAAATTVVSIAAFEILIGATAVVALLSPEARAEWRWPPITAAICAWFALTILSAAASGHFRDGYPQFKKFYVYLMLFLVFWLLRTIAHVRWLVIAWTAGATLSSLWSFVQLARKIQSAHSKHEDFYLAYIDSRITGFMGHWMTFSGQLMIVLMMLGAFYFFAPGITAKSLAWIYPPALAMKLALLAAFTRSMWLGALAGGSYLIWMWRRWMLLAIPVGIALVLLVNPFDVRERAESIFQPHGETDSNEHRVVTRKIGWEMIKAHPLLGVGPEQVFKQYMNYLPADVKLPLPPGYYGHLHNIYIHYAAERGIPAMLALIWAVTQALVDFIRGLRSLPADGRRRSQKAWVLHGAIAALIAVLISGWYELNLGDSEVLGLVLAVIACGYIALDAQEPA